VRPLTGVVRLLFGRRIRHGAALSYLSALSGQAV